MTEEANRPTDTERNGRRSERPEVNRTESSEAHRTGRALALHRRTLSGMFRRSDPERASARLSVALGVTTLAVATVLLSRCAAGDSSAQPSASATTTTASTVAAEAIPSPIPTVDPNVTPTVPADGAAFDPSATPTTTESTARGLETPVAASRNLFDSWRENDRVRALEYASLPAVETLFTEKWGAEVSDAGCNATPDPTVFRCTYVKDRKGWVATIAGNAARGFRVRVVVVVGRAGVSAGPITTAPETSAPPLVDGSAPDYVPEDAPIDPELIPPDPLDAGEIGDPTVDGVGPLTPPDTAPALGTVLGSDGLPIGTDAGSPATPNAGTPNAGTPNAGTTPRAKPRPKPKPKPQPAKKRAPKAKSAVGTPDPITAPPEPAPAPAPSPDPVPAGADPVQVVEG
jgi:hypothetical protein